MSRPDTAMPTRPCQPRRRNFSSIAPKALFTGRDIGTTRPRAVTLQMAGTELLMRVSSFHTVPPHQPRRGPVGGDGFDQPPSGIFGGKGNTLGLAGFDRQRVEPKGLPAVIEPVEQPEVMTVEMEDIGDWTFVGQGQHHNAAGLDAEGGREARSEIGRWHPVALRGAEHEIEP